MVVNDDAIAGIDIVAPLNDLRGDERIEHPICGDLLLPGDRRAADDRKFVARYHTAARDKGIDGDPVNRIGLAHGAVEGSPKASPPAPGDRESSHPWA